MDSGRESQFSGESSFEDKFGDIMDWEETEVNVMLENASKSPLYRIYDQVAQKISRYLTAVSKIHRDLSN